MIQDFYTLSSGQKDPKNLVVILHGYGSNNKNLLFMAQYWKTKLEDTLFIIPNAPTPLPHSDGYQWFEIGDLSAPYLQKGAQEMGPILKKFIKGVQSSYKISWEKTIIVGFSQGGMLALSTGLLFKNLCRGALSYSGGLFLPLSQVNTPPNQIDICLIHGEKDTVVPCAASEETHDQLKEKEYTVFLHLRPQIEHQIDETGLSQGLSFIKSVIQ